MAKIWDSRLALGALIIITSTLTSEALMKPLGRQLTCYSTLTSTEDTCKTNLSCFAYVTSTNKHVPNYGCIDTKVSHLFMCNAGPTSTFTAQCCNKDMCNKKLKLTLPADPYDGEETPTDQMTKVIYVGYGRTVIIAICISAPVCLITLAVMLFIYLRDRRLSFHHKSLIESDLEVGENKMPESIQDIINYDQTYSGSGSGLPLLIQRTIARQVILHDCIGKGRYGEVYRGKWRGEDVAIKIFSTRDECSWRRETEMYQTVMLRHEHILGFIAADNKDNGTWTQLWLVTDYHRNGSLCDYLTNVKELNINSMLDMAISIASGLTHLHMEVHGTRGKPAIAHRDLKSRNILVKNDGTCCIADLGLAVYYDACNDSFDLPSGSRVGTKRYMAPELLDNTEPKTFHEFKKIDIYAMGLVLWEIVRRCAFSAGFPLARKISLSKVFAQVLLNCERSSRTDLFGWSQFKRNQAKYFNDEIFLWNPSEEYQLPYYEKVQSDPSIEEMKETVCIEKFRPSFPKTWSQNQIMKGMAKIMQECWYESNAARLPALRVKKTLINLKCNDPVDV